MGFLTWAWDFPHIAVAVGEFGFAWAIARAVTSRHARMSHQDDQPYIGDRVDPFRRPSEHPDQHHGVFCRCAVCRRNRSERREAGKPPPRLRPDAELAQLAPHTRTNHCTNCSAKCRKHVNHPGWNNPLPRDVTLCDRCFTQVPEADRDEFTLWMGSDLVRTF